MPTTGSVGPMPKLASNAGDIGKRREPCRIDAVGNHRHFGFVNPQILRQKTAVRFGHRDERIGNRRQQSVEPANAIGPARAVQRGENHRHADAARGQPPPKHFVARPDRDDRINLPIA